MTNRKHTGITQGSILVNVCINDLPFIFNTFKCIIYDTTLYSNLELFLCLSKKSEKNEELKKINDWFELIVYPQIQPKLNLYGLARDISRQGYTSKLIII